MTSKCMHSDDVILPSSLIGLKGVQISTPRVLIYFKETGNITLFLHIIIMAGLNMN